MLCSLYHHHFLSYLRKGQWRVFWTFEDRFLLLATKSKSQSQFCWVFFRLSLYRCFCYCFQARVSMRLFSARDCDCGAYVPIWVFDFFPHFANLRSFLCRSFRPKIRFENIGFSKDVKDFTSLVLAFQAKNATFLNCTFFGWFYSTASPSE